MPVVFADIPPIGKDPCNGVVIEGLTIGRFEALAVQLFDDFGGLFTTAVHLENLPDDLRAMLVDLEMLVLVYIISE